jgi:hypothetical protein
MKLIFPVTDDIVSIIPHFVRHYALRGITEFIAVVPDFKYLTTAIRSAWTRSRLTNPFIVETFPMESGKEFIEGIEQELLIKTQKKYIGDKEWFAIADPDEFIGISNIPAFVERWRNMADYLHGTVIDRIDPDGRLLEIEDESNVYQLFPRRCNIMGGVFKSCINKVLLIRGDVSYIVGRHKAAGKGLFNMYRIDHFKWTHDVLERLFVRSERRKTLNLPGYKGNPLIDTGLLVDGKLQVSKIPL